MLQQYQIEKLTAITEELPTFQMNFKETEKYLSNILPIKQQTAIYDVTKILLDGIDDNNIKLDFYKTFDENFE